MLVGPKSWQLIGSHACGITSRILNRDLEYRKNELKINPNF